MRSSSKHDEMKKYAFPRIYIGLSFPFIWMWLPPLSNCPNTSDLLYFPLSIQFPPGYIFVCPTTFHSVFFVANMSGLHRLPKREMIFSDVIDHLSFTAKEVASDKCVHKVIQLLSQLLSTKWGMDKYSKCWNIFLILWVPGNCLFSSKMFPHWTRCHHTFPWTDERRANGVVNPLNSLFPTPTLTLRIFITCLSEIQLKSVDFSAINGKSGYPKSSFPPNFDKLETLEQVLICWDVH